MNEIEQAYKVLGVKQGASLREVDEAFNDLRALWQPDRLEDNPRLKAKAAGQIKEIEEAYRFLLEHLGRPGSVRMPEGAITRPAPPAPASEGSRDSTDKAAKGNVSLYDAAFSGRSTKKPWSKLPIGIFLILAIGILTVVAYMLQPTDQPAPGPDVEASGADTVESKLARIVDDVRKRETDESVSPEGAVGETPGGGVETSGPAEEAPESAAVPKPASPSTRASATVPEPRREPPARVQEPQTSRPAAEPQSARPRPEAESPAVQTPKPEAAPAAARTVDEQATARPQLARRGEVTEEGVGTQPDPPPEETGPSPAEQAAFDRLKKNSPVASGLIDGSFESLRYANWRIVQDSRDEYWIDVVCNWVSGGNEVHFIWAVSKSGDAVRPMSQAARNLESDYRPK